MTENIQKQYWTMRIRPYERLWHIDLGEIWRYRDFAILFTFLVQLWMFTTPIVYPLSMMPEGTQRTLIQANPMTAMKCEVRMIIKKLDGTPLAGFVKGAYIGRFCDIQPRDFTFERHIRFPKYMSDGDYLIDMYLHEPFRINYFEAPYCQTIHVKGFYDQYTRSLTLS